MGTLEGRRGQARPTAFGIVLALMLAAGIVYVLSRTSDLPADPEATARCKDARSELACSTCCGTRISELRRSPTGRSCVCRMHR